MASFLGKHSLLSVLFLPLLPILVFSSHGWMLLFGFGSFTYGVRKDGWIFVLSCNVPFVWVWSACLWSALPASRPSRGPSVSSPYQQHFVVPAPLSGLRICTTSLPDIQQPPGCTCTLSPLLTNGGRSGFRPKHMVPLA